MAELTTVARPYAKAAFQHALGAGSLSDWSRMLGFTAQVIKDEAVSNLLDDPKMTADQRTKVMEQVCADNVDVDMINFLSLLSTNDRLEALPAIVEIYEELKAQQEKAIDVNVTSAFELSDAQSTTISVALQKKLDRKVNIETTIDKSLIGGVIIRAGDMVIDSSVKGKLSKLAETVI